MAQRDLASELLEGIKEFQAYRQGSFDPDNPLRVWIGQPGSCPVDVTSIYAAAIGVFGDLDAAQEWLDTRSPGAGRAQSCHAVRHTCAPGSGVGPVTTD